jgi:peptidoglycan/LPS O-acetylase OafA/YrhL
LGAEYGSGMTTSGTGPFRRLRRLPTVADRWSPADNGITALRFMLAGGVFLAHAFTLSGLRDPVHVISGGQVFGGTVAVSAFFALSGFLLVQSRERQRADRFVTNRALRILPGFWVSIVVVGLVLVPAAALLSGSPVSTRDGLGYVIGNFGVVVLRDTIGTAFSTNAVSGTVNGSLWTLAPEIACYAALAVVPARALRVVVPAITVVIAVLHLSIGGGTNLHDLVLSFGLGATLAVGRRWVPLGAPVGLGLGGLLVVATVTGYYRVAAPFVVSYLALWAAVSLPIRWTHDLSYGVYIYAYPVQQTAVLLGLGFLPGMAIAAAATVALAVFSWTLVERPAMELRRRGRRRLNLVPESLRQAGPAEGAPAS